MSITQSLAEEVAAACALLRAADMPRAANRLERTMQPKRGKHKGQVKARIVGASGRGIAIKIDRDKIDVARALEECENGGVI